MSTAAHPVLAADPGLDSAKRRQILDGARRIFLAQGFEGASMNDIAKAAAVSKGTLYVYFENKERLFAAIVAEERHAHVTEIFAIDHGDPDIEGVLTRVGTQLAEFLANPRILSTMRVVMGISERMPDLGQEFYENGPCFSRGRLAAYLDARVAAGQLDIPDTMLAASQFLELSHSPVIKPMFFGSNVRPTPERIRTVVASALHMFMAAYGRKS
ncbi:TetR/AcrR family transcriptional regulator [Labrys wisconsinensis]|uniref:AcrR family transcriptional regulator n=1 Tax=Labrys wisconsinensis TaxID=425677 RepID=A0ABU0J2Y2_9HYPH|nr:TetR/AcrR family transcriptional regulator [Labrys wisconsinensis]MDQ0467567.1 AcrR family transcriptional regulator [Labrys wisconsinensis]